MTRKQAIEKRRAANVALTKRDRANRCRSCLRNLFEVDRPVTTLDGRRYCSDDCLPDAEEATA